VRIENMKKLARSQALRGETGIPVCPDDLDADPWLFNCHNGTIDLRTGRLQNHDRADLMTKCSPVAYDPRARSDLWEDFLATATSADTDLQRFLQTIAGYCLTGSNVEEKLFLLHGPTRSGKSTFVDALKSAMGDYAMAASVQAFMEQAGGRSSGHSEDLACLVGARMVAATEPRQGRRWDVEAVKSITGGDELRVSRKFEKSFPFTPQFKIVVAANEAPKIGHGDDAMWRRMVSVPFPVSIPEDQVDASIKTRLRDHDESGAVILAWAVQGCLLWQEHGLQVPDVVRLATAAYRDQMDPLGDWLAECCVIEPGDGFTPWGMIWESYRAWCENNNVRYPCKQRDIRERLEQLECTNERATDRGRTRGWLGIKLLGD